MELQDNSSETLNGTIWMGQLSSPSYQRLSSFDQQNERNVIIGEQISMGYHMLDGIILWQENKETKNDHQFCTNDFTSRGNSSISELPISGYHHSTSNSLKRPFNENHQTIDEQERKYIRRNESDGNNSSVQGWSFGQVEELAERLAADFDGPLSALALTDLASAVASYNVSATAITPISATVSNKNMNNAERNINNNGNSDKKQLESVSSLELLYSDHSDNFPTKLLPHNNLLFSQQGKELDKNSRFQCVLAAATSIATKINEETLTYLNQGQSYEIKLKKLGDLSAYRGKILKSTIRICFHERRLQYTEKEQILAWQRARPGERLLEVDVPLSYGMLDIVQPSNKNCVEFMWDPTKEVGVYIKVNCVSTEFTPKKHGGEKGVPFKIQVETLHPDGPRLHAASCQIKVFKLKGADRKHKQDRDKILRRPSHEQEKYQPSYDCTVLSDIPLDSLSPCSLILQDEVNSPAIKDQISPQILGSTSEGASLLSAENSPVSESNSEDSTTVMPTSSNERFKFVESHPPPKNRNVQEAAAWLRKYFPAHESTFVNYSGIDLLNLTRQELIQFCGPLDGVRMYNEITGKAPVPKLVIYCALNTDVEPIWKIVCLFERTTDALTAKLASVFNLSKECLHSVWLQGPRGIRVLMCNDLVSNMEKESVYLVQLLKDSPIGYFKLLLKPYDG